jgi:MFS transporter, FHS family, glucose/mannose:H+ symporter
VAIYGFGLGLIVPTDNLLIAEIGAHSPAMPGAGSAAPASKASAVSLLNFFWGVGAVFCSLMVAWTAAHKLLPFFLGATAIFLIALAISMRNLPFPPAETGAHRSASPSWRNLLKSPTIWLFACVFFFYPGAETSVGGWIGSYVSRLGPRGHAIASMMPAFFWSALTLGRALGTAFLRHVSERKVLRTCYATSAVGIALMLWSPSLTGVIVGALVTGLSYATLYPINVARLSERFGVAARSIGAAMFSLASVGPALLPWLVGVVSHNTGSLRAGLLLPLAATVFLFLIHIADW